MQEFEPDSESVSQADRLSSRLVQDLHALSAEDQSPERPRGRFSEQRYAEQAKGMRIDDVVENLSQMVREFAVGRRWDGTVACLDLGDGELAPISTANADGESPWGALTSEDIFEFFDRYGPLFPGRFRREFYQRATFLDDKIRMIGIEEAENGVRLSLRRFLSYRFAGLKMGVEARARTALSRRLVEELRRILYLAAQRLPGGGGRSGGAPPPGGTTVGGGLQVQVSCQTPGLRIHISPAYFINWVYFGSPTTPVTSYVLPGRYIFSGDGPMLPKRKLDPGVFCIPPTYRPSLVRF